MAQYRVLTDQRGNYRVQAHLTLGGNTIFMGHTPLVKSQDLATAVIDLAKRVAEVREKHRAPGAVAGTTGAMR